MKNLIRYIVYLILILLITNKIFGQNTDSLSVKDEKPITNSDKRFSIEIFAHFPYHYLHSAGWLYNERIYYKNYWNYGGGILISKYLKKVKVGTGFYLSTRNYCHKLETTSTVIIDKISYWNIPFLISFKVWRFSLFAGVIVTRPYHFNNFNNDFLRKEINTLTFHPPVWGGGPIPDRPLNYHLSTSGTLLLGLGYKQRIHQCLYLNLTLAYTCKSATEDIKVYAGTYEPSNANLVEGRRSICLNIGIEYIFFDKKK
jgi:hypothetical protein